MSLEFGLFIITELEPPQVVTIIAKLGLEKLTDSQLLGTGVLVNVQNTSTLRCSIIEEAFGFCPSLSVSFRIQPKENYVQGKCTLLRVTIELLTQVVGDAVLLFNGEDIVLHRLEGKLIINKKWDTWDNKILSELTASYERQELTSPLL
jgi:hypothetical protein